MKLATKILELVNSPAAYEYDNIRLIFKEAVVIGIFVFSFLILFQPFGLSAIEPALGRFIRIAGYGLISFLMSFIFDILISKVTAKYMNENNWKLKHEILHSCILISFIGVANFLYYTGSEKVDFYVQNFVVFQFYTLLVGALPVTIVLLLRQNINLKKYLQDAHKMNEQLQFIHKKQETNTEQDQVVIHSETKNEYAKIKFSDLLFIKSSGNYIELFSYKNNKVSATLIRNSLTRVEQSLNQFPSLRRCHRTYLVNINNIDRVIGDSRGYKLTFKQTDIQVPIARSYSKKMKQVIMGS